jgi:hypothetical protein
MENSIGWVLTALNLYSYFLVGNQNKIGFIVGGIGCILGIIMFSIIVLSIPMIVMYISFGILNTLNYFKWQVLKS